MIYFKIWEKQEYPYYGMKARILDLNELKDVELFMMKMKEGIKFMPISIKNITKNKDGNMEIESITLEEVCEN